MKQTYLYFLIIGISLLILANGYLSYDTWNSHINPIESSPCNPKSICECNMQDTLFRNGDYVKYLSLEKRCEIHIKLNGKNAEVPLIFNCPVGNLDLPSFFYKDKSSLYLIKGSGFNSREILVCEVINDSVKVKSFLTNRSDESNMDVFIYQNLNNKTQICVRGIFNLKNNDKSYIESNKNYFSIKIPKEYYNEEIEFSDIEKDHFVIIFKSGKKLILNIPEKYRD